MDAVDPRGPWRPILGDSEEDRALAAQVHEALEAIAVALAPQEESAAEAPAAAPTPSSAAAGSGDEPQGADRGSGPGAGGAVTDGAAGEAPDAAARRPSALADGPAGRALFFHYLDRLHPDRGYDDQALAHLEAAIAVTGDALVGPSLYGGFGGVAWTLEHLTGRLLEAPGPGEEDPGAEVAAALSGYLEHTPWLDEIDLIGGLVGHGVWAVERAPRSGAAEAAASIVARLGELAERRGDGSITWRTPPERMLETERNLHPNGNYNLGVAHGVPGMVGILGEMVATGLVPGETRALLDGAVAWLLRQRLAADAESCFSYTVSDGAAPVPARVAWCYGDPGVAVTLLRAARATGNAEWERQALAVALAAAARPRDATGVVDGGLCHGAAGLLHLYNRLSNATGEAPFAAAARTWLEQLMAMRKPGEGTAGWLAWRPLGDVTGPNPVLGWLPDSGFLTGAAGIGLALLGAVSPVEPLWDRTLLSAVPPRPDGPTPPA